jgi:hypothetical protein
LIFSFFFFFFYYPRFPLFLLQQINLKKHCYRLKQNLYDIVNQHLYKKHIFVQNLFLEANLYFRHLILFLHFIHFHHHIHFTLNKSQKYLKIQIGHSIHLFHYNSHLYYYLQYFSFALKKNLLNRKKIFDVKF